MYLPSVTPDGLRNAVRQLAPSETDAVLVLLSDEEEMPLTEIVDLLRAEGVSFFGAEFPGLIVNDRLYHSGCIIDTFPALQPPTLVRDMADQAQVTALFEHVDMQQSSCVTGLTIIDGLSEHGVSFLDRLNNRLGERIQFFGGGAGNKALTSRPCLFTNEGIAGDHGAVVCFMRASSSLGVRHGYTKMHGPIVATDTLGNNVKELNWGNALDLYRKVVEGDTKEQLNKENFFATCQRYPFGMSREGQEDIVREPVAFDETGELVCLAGIPTNSVLYILKANKDQLIGAARQAAHDASLGFDPRATWSKTMVFDCVSRPHQLDEDFALELSSIKEESGNSEVFGVLSIGEISTLGQGTLELFNETVVVGHLFGQEKPCQSN